MNCCQSVMPTHLVASQEGMSLELIKLLRPEDSDLLPPADQMS
jgi:hypothetical protein